MFMLFSPGIDIDITHIRDVFIDESIGVIEMLFTFIGIPRSEDKAFTTPLISSATRSRLS